jgi:hypothetical protein
VAEALGYRKANVLRNALKRYTGRRATELRTEEGGALAQVLAAFLSPEAFGRAKTTGEEELEGVELEIPDEEDEEEGLD